MITHHSTPSGTESGFTAAVAHPLPVVSSITNLLQVGLPDQEIFFYEVRFTSPGIWIICPQAAVAGGAKTGAGLLSQRPEVKH